MQDKIFDALQYLDSGDRPTWIMAGMAIKHELGEDGSGLWDDWSQQAKSYSTNAATASWRSFRGSGITISSLYKQAMDAGWSPDNGKGYTPISEAHIQAHEAARDARVAAEEAQFAKGQSDAAKRAAWALNQCTNEQHAYLHMKGWPDMLGPVWRPTETVNLLCIPMRVGQSLVGLQLIDKDGRKKFLKGQRTSLAEYCINNSGPGAIDFFVEGYATGLSLRDCLHAMRCRYRIHICFSAGNLKKMAARHGSGYVLADNDASLTGKTAAIATGLPYWISEVEGEDFNDTHKRLGLFQCSQMLKKWLALSKKQE